MEGKHRPLVIEISKPEEISQDLALSPRLQTKIRQRIRGLGVLSMMVYAVSLTFGAVAAFSEDPPPYAGLRLLAILFVIGLAAIIIGIVKRLPLKYAIILALVMEWLVCLLVSVTNPAYELPTGKTLPGLTWVVPIIVMFPLLIPTPPKWIVIASICCVMTVPVGTMIAHELDGRPKMTPVMMYLALISPLIAACIACFGAGLVYQTGVYAEKIRRAGSYQIQKELARGGMGVVYEAVHERLLRPAAIKYIQPDQLEKRFGSPEIARSRFEREAEVLAMLRSPNTVELYDYDLDDHGQLYYVMELLEGWDARTLVIERGVVAPARAVHFLAQVCRSLGEAHDFGMVHRDVKPSNIMVCRYGRDVDFVKVLDFGLMAAGEVEGVSGRVASEVEATGPDRETRLTRGNLVMGTPDFMSPEQVLRSRLDGRSDIYAVGAVGYWLLTGKVLYGGGSDREKMDRHVKEPPPRPSANTDQPIPLRLEELILACLAKRREERPNNADDLALAFLNSVEETWTPEKARVWWDDIVARQ